MSTQKMYMRLGESVTRQLFTVVFGLYLALSVVVLLCSVLLIWGTERLEVQSELSNLQDLMKPNVIAILTEPNDAVTPILEPQAAPQTRKIRLERLQAWLRDLLDHTVIQGVRFEDPVSGLPLGQYGLVKDPVTRETRYYDPEISNDTIESSVPSWAFYLQTIKTTIMARQEQGLVEFGTVYFFVTAGAIFKRILLSLILIILILVVLAIGLWQLFLRYGYQLITQPLSQLIQTIQNISTGQLSADHARVNITASAGTDLDILKLSFNSMMDKLTRSNEIIENTRNRLDAMINAMPAILIGVNREGRITDWNEQAAKFTKLSNVQVYGLSLDRAYPKFEKYLVKIDNAIREATVKREHKVAEVFGDQTVFFDILIYPVIQERFAGAVLLLTDITAQIKMEELIVQTEKMTSVGGLAAGVAHEINNPLGAILQSTQNIMRRLDPELPANQTAAQSASIDLKQVHTYLESRKILEFLDSIRQAGERAAGIVSNLLVFSRQTKSEKTWTPLSEIVERAIELAQTDYNMKKQLDFKKIKITRDYADKISPVWVCIMEIEQVILNLLKNASQAMQSAKTPDPEIKLIMTQPNTTQVSLEIIDNGPGMSESVRKRIFEPFFTTKPVGEGTGLGLSISFNLIKDHNQGTLSVESVENHGTKFIIILPTQDTTKK